MNKPHNALFLGFAAYPAIVAAGTSTLFNALVPCGCFSFVPDSHSEQVLGAVIKAEYIWGTSAVLLLTVCSWAIFYCGRVIWQCEPVDLCRRLVWLATFLSVLAAFYFLVPPYDLKNCISDAIFEGLLAGLKSGENGVASLDVILRVLAFCQAIGVATVIFAATAACTVLMVPQGDSAEAEQAAKESQSDTNPPASTTLTASDLEDRQQRLKGVLYVGAFALVTVFLFMQAFLEVPQALLPADTDAKPNPEVAVVKDLAEGLMVFWGSTLTLVLIAIFVPPSAILRIRSLDLAKATNPPGSTRVTLDTWMKARGLSAAWYTQLAKVLAMLSPLLSGPIAEAITRLVELAQ